MLESLFVIMVGSCFLMLGRWFGWVWMYRSVELGFLKNQYFPALALKVMSKIVSLVHSGFSVIRSLLGTIFWFFSLIFLFWVPKCWAGWQGNHLYKELQILWVWCWPALRANRDPLIHRFQCRRMKPLLH